MESPFYLHKIVDSAFPVLSSVKCISIFHLPPFSIFWSDYHLVDTVEDRVFRSFIFHLHLPSSTLCHRLKNFPNSLVFRSILSVSCQFPFKKHFHIPACLFENALLFSGSPLLFAAWDILCPPSAPFPVRYSLSPAFLNRRCLSFTLSSRLSFRRHFPSSMVCPKNALP